MTDWPITAVVYFCTGAVVARPLAPALLNRAGKGRDDVLAFIVVCGILLLWPILLLAELDVGDTRS